MNIDKKYGFRGTLEPSGAFKDIKEELIFGNIKIIIKDGVFEVGYDHIDEKERAYKIANSIIASWSKRNNLKITIEFNQEWEVKPDGNRFVSIGVYDEVKLSDRVITSSVTIQGKAFIVKPHNDSYSFTNDIDIVRKAEQDETLA